MSVEPTTGQPLTDAFDERQRMVVALTDALRSANHDVERLRSGIQAIIDDAWLSRVDDVMDALRELLGAA